MGRFRMSVYDLRYLTMPLILQGMILVARLIAHRPLSRVYAIFIFLFMLPLADSIKGYYAHPIYNKLATCILKLKETELLKEGFSGYWMTKPLEHYSDYTLHLAQLDEEFKLFKWMNRTDSLIRKRDGSIPKFNYVIEDSWLTAEKITRKFGKPDKIFSCEAGPFNNGFLQYPTTTVNVHFYSSDVLEKYARKETQEVAD
ncbi:MAG: hypothetical protein EOO88_54975 [Pedobacter sp.]|nr:MAG: hypothetical protein EOO88_54975 [Pedobacter sp.]